MKKILCFAMVTVVAFLCSACMSGWPAGFEDRDSELADARMEQLFSAIKAQDQAAIKAAFSPKAQAEAGNLDAGVAYLLSAVQGEAVSWERDESPVVFDSVEYGYTTKQLVTWYTLKTDRENYLVFLWDYPIDTMDPENAGLYCLRIIRAEDEDTLEGAWEDWAVPGIWIPDPEV